MRTSPSCAAAYPRPPVPTRSSPTRPNCVIRNTAARRSVTQSHHRLGADNLPPTNGTSQNDGERPDFSIIIHNVRRKDAGGMTTEFHKALHRHERVCKTAVETRVVHTIGTRMKFGTDAVRPAPEGAKGGWLDSDESVCGVDHGQNLSSALSSLSPGRGCPPRPPGGSAAPIILHARPQDLKQSFVPAGPCRVQAGCSGHRSTYNPIPGSPSADGKRAPVPCSIYPDPPRAQPTKG
jgi:hypothetical protein